MDWDFRNYIEEEERRKEISLLLCKRKIFFQKIMRSIKATVQEVEQYFKPNLGIIKMSNEGFFINLLLQIQEKSPSAHRSYCSAGSVRLDRLRRYLSGNQNLMGAHLLGRSNRLERAGPLC